jgi:hypothetical protein
MIDPCSMLHTPLTGVVRMWSPTTMMLVDRVVVRFSRTRFRKMVTDFTFDSSLILLYLFGV